MGLLEIFNYGVNNDYYNKKKRELATESLSTAGGVIDQTQKQVPWHKGILWNKDKKQKPSKDITIMDSPEGTGYIDDSPEGKGKRILPSGTEYPGSNINQIQKQATTPFHPSQGGDTKTNVPQDPKWWEKLANMAGVDPTKAAASWKDKGGFEGLMANPAFTMGLAFMQAGAEGKTIGQGALDNVMKAAGISSHYKKILKDRQEEPIQATAADMAEVESLLGAINIEEGNWAENLWSKIKSKGKANPKAEWSAAVEEISLKYQEKVRAKQKKLKKAGKPQTLRRSDKLKIMQELIDSREIEKDNPLFFGIFTAGTLKKKLPSMAQGGQIQAGQPAIVGEGGPEYFLPQESGKILSNDDSRIFSMLLSANPQLQNVSRTRAEKILRNRFPEYFE
jgi:hypothetical protein